MEEQILNNNQKKENNEKNFNSPYKKIWFRKIVIGLGISALFFLIFILGIKIGERKVFLLKIGISHTIEILSDLILLGSKEAFLCLALIFKG